MAESPSRDVPQKRAGLGRCVAKILLCIPLVLLLLYGCRSLFLTSPKPLPSAETTKDSLPPLVADEEAALRWLDHVLGPLSAAEEKDWWNVGGRQFGLSSMPNTCGAKTASTGSIFATNGASGQPLRASFPLQNKMAPASATSTPGLWVPAVTLFVRSRRLGYDIPMQKAIIRMFFFSIFTRPFRPGCLPQKKPSPGGKMEEKPPGEDPFCPDN